jgi:hypothetical protein
MLTLKKIIKACLPYGVVVSIQWFIRDGNIWKYNYSKKIFKKYYAPKYGKPVIQKKENVQKQIIYITDGRRTIMGLADLFRGMVSIYKISRNLNVDFKINMTSPVELSNFLIPNKYNWKIDQNEIIYDIKESVIVEFSYNIQEDYATKIILSLLKKKNQIHITTNMFTADREYADLFNELFKPSDELENRIQGCLSEIGCDFISASFRFQELLGDFHEGPGVRVLPDTEQIALINRCIDHLMEIYKENRYKKMLVTSDSITFLNKAKELDFVYVVPGEIAHFAYYITNGKEVHMKTFLDYFLLTYSKMVYQVIDGQMYASGFPRRAALHNFPFKMKRY